LAERQALELQQAAVWTERRAALRERAYRVAERLIEKAEDILAMPLLRKKIERGKGPEGIEEAVILEPVRFSIRDAGSMAVNGMDLAKWAAGLLDKTLPDDDKAATETELDGVDDEELLRRLSARFGLGR